VRLGLNGSYEPLNVLDAGQHGLAWQYNSNGCYLANAAGTTEALRMPQSLNCILNMLTEAFQPTRLETRTKESNPYASWWVVNP
jgi:hypothetical protein